ncbi:hypothetical protein [Rubrivirga sp.]|uniref:hypothetical protein n=1 Tax=Rubrivirga sp. TaxID=1885344 RepID=UPI003C73D5C3
MSAQRRPGPEVPRAGLEDEPCGWGRALEDGYPRPPDLEVGSDLEDAAGYSTSTGAASA